MGKTTQVDIDLVPKTTQVRVRVLDGDGPSPGIPIWVDGESRQATNKEGQYVFDLAKGDYLIKVDAGDMVIERRISVTTSNTVVVNINLRRERRLMDLSDGVELGGAIDASDIVRPEQQNQNSTVAAKPQQDLATGSDMFLGNARTSSALGRYMRVAELGRGAMGVVYKAHDSVLERDVALKILTDELKEHPDALRFFMQEAKSLAQLNHPNVVAVYDQGEDESGAFMVMEFVEGTTLEGILEKQSPLGIKKALELTEQVCAGLAYAHGKRVIHRDIKPANILISLEDGMAKLGDFGLARVIKELSIRKTEIRGTPLYMSPEQITGTDIDFRADLYSVGCTLYELLTGQPPFYEGEVMYHHLHTAPKNPSEVNPSLPKELDPIVLSCLAKKSSDRVESAKVLQKEIEDIRRSIS